VAYRQPARTATRRVPRIPGTGLLVVIAAIAAVPGYMLLASPSSIAASPLHVLPGEHRGPPAEGDGVPHTPPGAALGEADGAVPDGTTIFDDDVPGVAKLDPALLRALQRAATAAGDDGIAFLVDSGWRSPKYQEQLLQEAVATYGSVEAAARWVATPNTSAHVSGDAVDLGPEKATAWLSKHGGAYGLCQIYRNEPWHYELRTEAMHNGCPRMYADPTQDPRMQQ
jgi:zinc D-Ala-D-Ala carboxypeptidase